MNFRLFKIFTILVSFLFLTGFTPLVSIIGPGVTVLTSGNIYKATAQFIIDQSIKKKTGKNSLTLVKEELDKKKNKILEFMKKDEPNVKKKLTLLNNFKLICPTINSLDKLLENVEIYIQYSHLRK